MSYPPGSVAHHHADDLAKRWVHSRASKEEGHNKATQAPHGVSQSSGCSKECGSEPSLQQNEGTFFSNGKILSSWKRQWYRRPAADYSWNDVRMTGDAFGGGGRGGLRTPIPTTDTRTRL